MGPHGGRLRRTNVDEFSVQLVEALATTLGIVAPLVGLALATVATCAWAKELRTATSAAAIPLSGVRAVATPGVRPETVRLSSCLSSRAPPQQRAGVLSWRPRCIVSRAAADLRGIVPGAQ